MRLRVEYQDGCLEFEAPEDRLVAGFGGPAGPPSGSALDLTRQALEASLDYPPLRQAVVPGDRVALPVDTGLPEAGAVLSAIVEVLREVGVESITAVVDRRERDRPELSLPAGVELLGHDPTDRESLAYLATTEGGRRVYLNRSLAEADIVIPIGRIGPEEGLGVRGPWSVIEPGLSDREPTPVSLLAPSRAEPVALAEALEISWLLGSMYQVGVLPGRSGVSHVLAGQTAAIRDRGQALLHDSWGFQVEDRADLVIAGIGGPGREVHAAELIEGIRQAFRLVRHGGKVALLTGASAETIRQVASGTLLPRGDWEKALAWADVYLASKGGADDLDNLGVIPLDRPEQAIKLASVAPSFLTISQADRVRAAVPASERARRSRPDVG
jgi:hypothetical protein